MVSIETIQQHVQNDVEVEYLNTSPLDIFDSLECQALATQAIAHRHLTINQKIDFAAEENVKAIPVILVEDRYPGWLRVDDLVNLAIADEPYQPKSIDREAIAPVLNHIVQFAKDAMVMPNEYLWGGTIGPNLDCSGLVQRAYGSQGIWLPRDAYQQEAFTQELTPSLDDIVSLNAVLAVGDLLFFGTPEKATHVAIYLGQGQYIHSSGKDQGRDGIGIDSLTDLAHPVSQTYFKQYRGAGRVMQSFCP